MFDRFCWPQSSKDMPVMASFSSNSVDAEIELSFSTTKVNIIRRKFHTRISSPPKSPYSTKWWNWWLINLKYSVALSKAMRHRTKDKSLLLDVCVLCEYLLFKDLCGFSFKAVPKPGTTRYPLGAFPYCLSATPQHSPDPLPLENLGLVGLTQARSVLFLFHLFISTGRQR